MNAKARILFVDDEQRVLNAMRGLFRRDFELFLTTDGAEAVRIAEQESIDVLVADQRMPGMTGVEVLGKVKKVSPTTVRILLTGYADLDAIEGSINIGEVFRFLSKPCPPPVLRETLTQAVSTARASAEAVAASAAPAPAAASSPSPAPDEQRPAADTRQPSIPVLKDAVPTVTETAPQAGFDTEIVLAGDSSTEQQSATEAAGNVVADIGIAVFSIDPGFAETTVRALSSNRDVSLATNLARVLDVLEQQRAGVLVTDYTDNVNQLRNMIGSLKQVLPELVTIVVSENRDASDMIALINYGQVFRYVDKPLDVDRFLNDVNAAALRHIELVNHPELLQRHAVVAQQAEGDADAGLIQFIGRIKQLGNPWRRINR